MRSDMAAYPEIVFIDGTYNFFKLKLTLMLIVIEDGDAETQIVGVGILSNETRPTLKWFIECFKEVNLEACSKIKCFMTDKDLTERSVIKEVLPGIPTLICLFHTLRTFGREITTDKRDINKEERDIALGFVNRLAKAKSEQNYDTIYAEFCKTVPDSVLEYFNHNWHPIRTEWTLYNMNNGNLGNTTNNRLESLNGKLKLFIDKNNTLVGFINDFFKLIVHRDHQSAHKRAQEFLRKEVRSVPYTNDESMYKELLKNHAFTRVMTEISGHQHITLSVKNAKTLEYCVNLRDKVITVTVSQCECGTWTSELIPCRHIFAVRKLNHIPLFDKSLCATRWHKDLDSQLFPS